MSPSAKVQDRLPLQLPTPHAILAAASNAGIHQLTSAATEAGAYMDLVLEIAWMPGSDTCLAVTMPLAVVVYDLTVSARRPKAAVVLPSSDFIASSAVGTHLIRKEVRPPVCLCNHGLMHLALEYCTILMTACRTYQSV